MSKKFGLVLTIVMVFHSGAAHAFAAASGIASATSHMFPQVVDGRLSDGAFYTSTLMVSNHSETRSAGCTVIFRGFRPTVKDSWGNVTLADAFTIDIEAGQGDVLTTTGTAEFQAGYVTISCDQQIDALVLYTLHAPSGVTMSEAAVLSSGRGTLSQLVVDQRNGARLGVAVNNDSDMPVAVRLKAGSYTQALNSSNTLTIPPRSTVSRFIDEVVALPTDFVGQVLVESLSERITVMGLRFTGTTFTTIPASVRVP